MVVEQVFENFVSGIVAAMPNILNALVFLVLSYAAIRIILYLARISLENIYPSKQIVSLGLIIIGIFLWFGAGLIFLKLLGLGDIAASLGTATGFLALGIAFAVKDMIADTVAGVYLIRDPDFERGDAVETADTTGTVEEVGLRKSRLELENGDTAVLSNSEVENKWTKKT